jgi:hypothetical protein
MRGLNPSLLFASTRVRSKFADNLGNTRVGTGTGFWIHASARPVLVTNRHNLDQTWLFPDLPELQLVNLEIELRLHTPDAKALNLTRFFEVTDLSRVRLHRDTDAVWRALAMADFTSLSLQRNAFLTFRASAPPFPSRHSSLPT